MLAHELTHLFKINHPKQGEYKGEETLLMLDDASGKAQLHKDLKKLHTNWKKRTGENPDSYVMKPRGTNDLNIAVQIINSAGQYTDGEIICGAVEQQ